MARPFAPLRFRPPPPRRHVPWAALLAIVACGVAQRVEAQLPETAHRYELSAVLDAPKHTIRGSARITFRNTSRQPVQSLVFHLYLNAFRDRQSVFMRESGGQLRGDEAGSRGSITLNTLTVDGHDVLRASERELVPHDQTQLRAKLPTTLVPGGTVTIETTFVTRLPEVFARSGYAGDFNMIAQWFPKLAALERDGTFASFPYHALSEFYADFADYRVELDTPSDFVVGATGLLAEERKVGARTVRRFDAPAVHDVAIVASPKLMTKRSTVNGIEVIALYPPGYELALVEHEAMVKRGLRHFGERFGPYPYRTLTFVIPPRDAAGAAGMEYPMLFMTEGPWFETPSLEGFTGAFVTAHELAHQWFQGLIASNEERWPVLDEGLAEWAAIDLLRNTFGEGAPIAPFVPISRFEVERLAATQFAPPAIASDWRAGSYTDTEYGRTIYSYTAVALESIRRAYGRARFDRALRLYADRQRFHHPQPSDLEQAFDDVYGAGFAARTLSPLVFGGATSAVHLGRVRSGREGKAYATEVRVRRTGSVALPTWIAAYSEQGKQLARTPFPANLTRLDTMLRTKEPVAHIAIDPDRALLIDPDTRDQVRTLRDVSAPSWLVRLSGLLQALLSMVGP